MRNVQIALSVLEQVALRGPVGVSELARVLELPKTTVHRSLQTLAQSGWITADEESGLVRWTTSSKPVQVFGRATGPAALQTRALPAMRELARQTSETIHLTIRDGAWMVLLDKVESTHQVRTVSWVGGRSPVFAGASGLAFLAALDDAEARAVVGKEFVTFTDKSLSDVDALIAELHTVRRRGYAVNPGMWRDDIAAVGAAILDAEERPIAALSISTPAHRLPPQLWDTYGDLVRSAAKQIGFTSSH